MEDQESKAKEWKGLEEEIDQAIDSLFVEKGSPKEKTRSESAGEIFPQSADFAEEGLESVGDEVEKRGTAGREETFSVEVESPVAEAEKMEEDVDRAFNRLLGEKEPKAASRSAVGPGIASQQPARPLAAAQVSDVQKVETASPREERALSRQTEEPQRNLENLEAHLLSLDWEISPDLIRKVISELAFLKEAYRHDAATFQAVGVMEKVARSLGDDAKNITPENLRFLMEAKDGIKLLGKELKDKEDYKSVILSGLLARYELLTSRSRQGEGRGERAGDGDLESLAHNLQNLSQRLQSEIHELGSITHRLCSRTHSSATGATVSTVLVESSGKVFAVERESVVRAVRLPYRTARRVWAERQIQIGASRLPLVNLFRLLELKGRIKADGKVLVFIKKGERNLGLLVDRLLQRATIPSNWIREERHLPYVRGTVTVGKGRDIYLLDMDRIMAQS